MPDLNITPDEHKLAETMRRLQQEAGLNWDPSHDKGRHFDDGKADWSLLPFEALEPLVKVLEYGAKKYGRVNWQKGIHFLRVWNSAIRHLTKWRRGVDLDDESGLSHLAHAMCNILFLTYYSQVDALRAEFDNRKEV